MNRVLEPEWLDTLPADDQEGAESRHDLQRLNFWLGHAGNVARVLASSFQSQSPKRLAELGAGDGTFMLRVARLLAKKWRNTHITLVDRNLGLSDTTRAEYEILGWSVESITSEALDWLNREPPLDCLVANLFLHHLEDDKLADLFFMAAKKTKVFVGCEPRRSHTCVLASRGLGALGANRITRHDAPISVRAGFRRHELSQLWTQSGWQLHESRAGMFSHLFVARRNHLI